VAAYKIVFHDANGEPLAESSVEQPDDDSAVTHATRHRHPYILQVWRGADLVAAVPPRPKRV
jgi:hypothetical protein